MDEESEFEITEAIWDKLETPILFRDCLYIMPTDIIYRWLKATRVLRLELDEQIQSILKKKDHLIENGVVEAVKVHENNISDVLTATVYDLFTIMGQEDFDELWMVGSPANEAREQRDIPLINCIDMTDLIYLNSIIEKYQLKPLS